VGGKGEDTRVWLVGGEGVTEPWGWVRKGNTQEQNDIIKNEQQRERGKKITREKKGKERHLGNKGGKIEKLVIGPCGKLDQDGPCTEWDAHPLSWRGITRFDEEGSGAK